MGDEASGRLLAEVPVEHRGRIVSGMRWTFWLSVLGVPFSYGITVLLARAGPEVIGTYGLLVVYIGAVASLFYIGGDAVIIRFVPGLDRQSRLPFLMSYFLVVAVFLVVWMVVSTLWPGQLRYLFGETGGTSFQLLIVYLSPLYVLFSMIVAAYKATLDMRTAHLLVRLITIGSFLLYAALFLAARQFLEAHPAGLIWGIYLGLTALAAVVGIGRLVTHPEWKSDTGAARLFLPPGFWRYALTTEQVSVMAFLIGRMDLILVMNVGGVSMLGKYVTIISLAEVVRAASRFFLDTLLPSLTNLFNARKTAAASQVFSMTLRLLFAVNLVGTFTLVALVDPVLALLGPQYANLRLLFVLMLLFHGIAAPGTCGAILLSSVGQQHRTFWVYLGQVAMCGTLFFVLWPRYQLLGAVLAMGTSVLIFSVMLLVVARQSTDIWFSAIREYSAALIVGTLLGFCVIRLQPSAIVARILLVTGAVSGFLLIARYSVDECREMLTCFLPGMRRTCP